MEVLVRNLRGAAMRVARMGIEDGEGGLLVSVMDVDVEE